MVRPVLLPKEKWVGQIGDFAMTVRVIDEQELPQTSEDFVRVSCEGDESTGVFTRIERVLGRTGGSEATGGLRLRKLYDGLLGSREMALTLATAYARHKGIPLVYAADKPRR